MKIFPYYQQETCWTCGPALARMFLANRGVKKSEKQLVKILKTNKIVGTRQEAFVIFAKKYKLIYFTGANADLVQLKKLWEQGFFVIVSFLKTVTDDPRYPFKLRPNFAVEENHLAAVKKITGDKIILLDTAFGPDETHSRKKFVAMWSKLNHYEKTRRWFIALK